MPGRLVRSAVWRTRGQNRTWGTSQRTASASVGNLGLRRDSLALDRERRLAGCSGRFPQL